MSYILYGGLFDPPHNGHMQIAEAAYKRIMPEEIIWIPARYPVHRDVEGISADARMELLRCLLDNRFGYSVSDVELNEDHPGFSIDTVLIFKRKYHGRESYFLIGTDEAENFTSWKRWEDIIENTTLVIGRRKENTDIPEEVRENAIMLDNSICPISSTEIRSKLERGIIPYDCMDDKITSYIKEHGYYGTAG
ncbi:MAG: nicotinate (nicotinamide) nucleotide adenylyltransferase [Elusimicrobiota bacterium]